MPVLIGLDIGTSGAKCAAFDETGRVLCETTASYPCFRPRPGWAEHDPNDWWNAACLSLSRLCEQIDSRELAAIGVDGISWSIVPIDRDGNALARSPIWMDNRAEEQRRTLAETYGADALLQLSGNPVESGFSLPKLLWMREQNPALSTRAACWLESNAFIAFRLTGVRSIDPTQGFGWACFDMQNNTWDDALCRDLAISDVLPPVRPSHEVIGTVTLEAARQTGLPAGLPVIAGGMDTPCGCLAAGVHRLGQMQEQGGQSGGVALYAGAFRPDPRLMLFRHVVPEGYFYSGATTGGSASYAWVEREFGQPERKNGEPDFDALNDLAASVPAGSDGLLFLPYMNGERAPIFDPYAKGVYFGLDFSKTRAHLIRATLEGVAFSVRHSMETVMESGAEVSELLSVGGAAKSALWMQIKADVTGRRMLVKRTDVGSALGVAMTAGVGVGVYADFASAVAVCDRTGAVYEPNPVQSVVYDRLFELYKRLYTQTKDIMHELAGETAEA